ncbi:MAG: NAAT family transporter, partial [Nanoarchaeota archaeon]
MATLDIAFLVLSLASLFSIINPLSAATVFMSITKSNTLKEKHAMAKKSVFIAAVILIFFALAGNYILQFFSITLEAFRIAGGLLIGYIGFEMLHYGKKPFKSKKEEREAVLKKDVSIVPLAIPMMSGPGAITTSIV